MLLLLTMNRSALASAATSGGGLLLQQELDLLVSLLDVVLQAQDLGFEEFVLSQINFQPTVVHLQGFDVDDAVGRGPCGLVCMVCGGGGA